MSKTYSISRKLFIFLCNYSSFSY